MKAVKLTEPAGEVHLTDVEIPVPGPGEILVRVEASGLCHTDVHLCDAGLAAIERPTQRDLTLGHEAVGIIEARGEGVTTHSVGDRVAAPFLFSACGTCKQCRHGEENHCTSATTLGHTYDGSHAEYFTALADFVVPVPDGLAPEQAAPLACAGMTVLGGLRRSGVTVGDTVGVIGVGGQGHLAIQIAKAMGATVIGMDVSTDKVDLARRCGADHAYDVSQPDTLATLKALGINVVVVTAPNDEAHTLAVDVTTKGGVISLCAAPRNNTSISITDIGAKGLTLIGQAVATRRDLADILDLAAAGKVRCEVQTRPLEDAVDSIDQLRRGDVVGRIVFVP